MTEPETPTAALQASLDVLTAALATWQRRDDRISRAEVWSAANTAVDAVDTLLGGLHQLRSRLHAQIRASDDAASARTDAPRYRGQFDQPVVGGGYQARADAREAAFRAAVDAAVAGTGPAVATYRGHSRALITAGCRSGHHAACEGGINNGLRCGCACHDPTEGPCTWCGLRPAPYTLGGEQICEDCHRAHRPEVTR